MLRTVVSVFNASFFQVLHKTVKTYVLLSKICGSTGTERPGIRDTYLVKTWKQSWQNNLREWPTRHAGHTAPVTAEESLRHVANGVAVHTAATHHHHQALHEIDERSVHKP